MRRGWQLTVAGVSVAALATAVAVSARPDAVSTPPAARAEASTSPTASGPPAVIRDCWVPASPENVSLTSEEAMALTTVAGSSRPERREVRVRRAVDRTLDLPAAQADVLTRSLVGDKSALRLTCSYARDDVDSEDAGPSGLTPRARRLRTAWTEVFGPLIAGGFARGGVSSGHVDSSSHYDGRAIDVFFRPLGDAEQRRNGRVFAQWLVAHAQEYQVLSVIYADRIWTSWASYAGWRDYVHPSGNRTNSVLRHLDHVHVAVESGRRFRR